MASNVGCVNITPFDKRESEVGLFSESKVGDIDGGDGDILVVTEW
jgi:hypothetical protein